MFTKELVDLAKLVIRKAPPANYSLEDAKTALNKELKEILGSPVKFDQNKYALYELMQQQYDAILPRNVITTLGQFANIQSVPQGNRMTYKRKIGKNRAKAFITQVGLSGLYESFRLDSKTFTVTAKAVGGAARLDWERFLDGHESLDDYFEVVLTGLEEAIYVEVQTALRAAIDSMPAANKVIANNFDPVAMKKLVSTVRAYSNNVVIFAPPEFVAEMDPTLITTGAAYPNVHTDDLTDLRNTGYIGKFFGAPVVILPQTFIDENNTTKVIDTQTAYVFPAGDEKVVQIVLEGDTQIMDIRNPDFSVEIQAYKKFGVAILNYNNWAAYRNEGIPQEADLSYGYSNL